MKSGGKPDGNQDDIVSALRRAGYSVAITSDVGGGFTDLVLGRNGRNLLMEIKVKGGKLTPKQQQFHDDWKGRACIAYGIADALILANTYLGKGKERHAHHPD